MVRRPWGYPFPQTAAAARGLATGRGADKPREQVFHVKAVVDAPSTDCRRGAAFQVCWTVSSGQTKAARAWAGRGGHLS